MYRVIRLFVVAVAALLLAACGDPSKQDILKKAENAKTKTDLEQALGKPDNIDKLGPLEKWTYKASNGTVIFAIAGNTVTIQSTGD